MNLSDFKYLPIYPENYAWGIRVTGCGSANIKPDHTYPPPDHPEGYDFTWDKGRVLRQFAFVYLTSGVGIFDSIPTGQKSLSQGSLVVLFPGVWHRYRPDSATGWHEHWLTFDGEFAERIISQNEYFTPEKAILHVGKSAELLRLFEAILLHIKREPPGYQEIIASQTMNIIALAKACNTWQSTRNKEAEKIVQDAKVLMSQSISESINIVQIANKLDVGYSWFRQLFKEYTGLAPNQYLLQMRLHKAKILLESTTLSIGVIAESLGFQNQFYFSRLFKEKTGLSPRQWRNS